ncbi:hypothetical protein EXIGLDRAFT_776137 [Exidia glandulosa HHB12029]|uniref:Uncharacterized protein n=1 Tax=Exidia glandulosa HHB12029 TaxID=1314781 RepID=A0A165DLC3_EXIGL|nr:hypothetical protein EXIGLDRAFT_776137 [Exidia glandulosa HHB12029]
MSESSAPPAPPTTDEILPLLIPAIMRDVASLTAQSVLYGMYLIVFTVAIYNLLQASHLGEVAKILIPLRRRKAQGAWMVLTVSISAAFIISTFLWASNVAVLWQRMNTVFVGTEGTIIDRIDLANSSTEKVRYMNDVMFVISYIIGDAVIAWRIFILSQRMVWVSAVMGALWLATGFGLIGCLVHSDFPSSDLLPRLCTNFENVSWVISLIFNGLATVLLARLARSHRKASMVINSKKRSKVDRVLSILVVSGVVYFILGVPRLSSFANQTLNPLPSNLSYATQIIEAMLYQLVGLYPTMVTAFLFYESKLFAGTSTTSGSGATTGTSMFDSSKTAAASAKPYSYGGSTRYGSAVVMMGSGKHSSTDDTSVEKA